VSESGRDYYGWMTNDGRRVERVGGGGHGAIAREQLGYGHLDAEHAGDQALRDGHVRYLRNNSSMVVELHHSRPDAAERAASMIRSHAGDRFVVDLFDHPEGQAVDSHGKTWLNTTRKHEALDFLQRAATRRAPATDIARARALPYGESAEFSPPSYSGVGKQLSLPSWATMHARRATRGDEPSDVFGFIKPDGAHVWDWRHDWHEPTHDDIGRTMGIKDDPTPTNPETLDHFGYDPDPKARMAVKQGHVRFIMSPEGGFSPSDTIQAEFSAKHPVAMQNAHDFVASHCAANPRVFLDVKHSDRPCATCKEGSSTLHSSVDDALGHIRTHMRGRVVTDVARARQFPYGEGVADAFIRQQLLEAAPDLQLTAARQAGRHFETGRPVEFRYVRNTERAPHMGSRFGQDIEPHGRYMVHNEDPGDVPRGWETGTHRFENPIVMRWGTTTGEPHGWKHRLSSAFGGKKGKALSAALRRRGHDGIVTVDEFQGQPDVREIVALGDHR